MVVEERIYSIRSGAMLRYLDLVRNEGIAIQQRILGRLIGYFTTEIGTLSQVTHMWAYASLEDRTRRRSELAEDPQWQAFVPRLAQYIERAENRILVPKDFSPRPGFAHHATTLEETQS
ncbi:NIPSNAP family containing protein [Burkholderia sp. H160]|nr:NIPSNAP family containing protein [Burkholderia sp. H160]